MNTNRILYKYIVDKYGDVVNLSEISGISPIDLNAVLLKDNVSKEICIGLCLCDILNIDIEKMVFDGQIQSVKNEKPARVSNKTDKSENTYNYNQEEAAKYEIYGRCIRLSEIEKKEVLEYIESISSLSK